MTLRKPNETLTNKKQTTKAQTPTYPTFKKINGNTLVATICLLTIVILGTITGGFGSFISTVRADTINGIGVGIYWNQACTNKTSALNWGQIYAGSNKTIVVYVKNENNSPVSLKLDTSNWNPVTAYNYITLSWDYSGQVIKVNEVIPIELTLAIESTINGVSDFSFNTAVTTIEQQK